MLMHGSRIKNSIKNSNRGAALMVAVVIIGILMVFVLSLLLVTYPLYASQNKKSASRRNAEAANTFSVALTKELVSNGSAGELWRYLRFNVCTSTWPYYMPGEEGHGEAEAFRYFNVNYNFVKQYFDEPDDEEQDPLSGLEGFPGKMELCIYWKAPTEHDMADSKTGTRLFIEVICETGSQSYVIKNEYALDAPRFETTQLRLKNALSGYAQINAYNPLQQGEEDGINLDENWNWTFVGRE